MEEQTVPQPEPATLGYPPEKQDLTPWSEAEAVLVERKTYWLATVRPDGPPHVMPVWGVWMAGRFFFSTSPASRKGKNIARNPRCTISLSGRGLDLVLEGTASLVTEDETATKVAALYGPKYDWPVTVRDRGIYGENGDGGPLYAVTPETAFAFGLIDGFSATRWRF